MKLKKFLSQLFKHFRKVKKQRERKDVFEGFIKDAKRIIVLWKRYENE
jgi:hypothetical protein